MHERLEVTIQCAGSELRTQCHKPVYRNCFGICPGVPLPAPDFLPTILTRKDIRPYKMATRMPSHGTIRRSIRAPGVKQNVPNSSRHHNPI